MNEKIKELAEQAGWHDYKQFATFNRIYQWQDFDKEKFAELIVLECAKIGSRAMYPDSDPDYVGRKIKQHFGVK